MRVYIDMDGVIVNLISGWIPYLNKITGKNLSHGDIDIRSVEKKFGVSHYIAGKPLREKMFWESLPPYPGAVEAVKRIHNLGIEIYVSTTPFTTSPSCCWGKKKWFENHLYFLPYNRLIFIYDKYLLDGDAIIDDKPENIIKFNGRRILWDQPWNRNLNSDVLPQWFSRAHNWREVESLLCQ